MCICNWYHAKASVSSFCFCFVFGLVAVQLAFVVTVLSGSPACCAKQGFSDIFIVPENLFLQCQTKSISLSSPDIVGVSYFFPKTLRRFFLQCIGWLRGQTLSLTDFSAFLCNVFLIFFVGICSAFVCFVS